MARHKKYDEDKLVELLSSGMYRHETIAEIVGLSANFVYRVSKGKARVDLYERIQKKTKGPLSDTMLLGKSWVKNVLAKHVNIALTDGETARKCREYVLDHFLFGDEATRDSSSNDSSDPSGIALREIGEFYKWKSQTSGGPTSTQAGA